METYFATAERSSTVALDRQIEVVSGHPVMDGLLQVIGGCIAVLNGYRQIVALNETLIHMMGVEDAGAVMGLRLGEALTCSHASDMPGGCGTGQACTSCGAAIAIVSSLGSERPVERNCSVSATRNGQPVDLFFRVNASPLRLDDDVFILLFLQDISRHQQLEALERIFFHDINNTLMGLMSASDLLLSATGEEVNKMARFVQHFTFRLHQEFSMQRYLIGKDMGKLELQYTHADTQDVLDEVQRMVAYHPAAMEKRIQRSDSRLRAKVYTDIHILQRVLTNMLINALEATETGLSVRLDATLEHHKVIFSVWNPSFIPPEISQRVFQKNFSSKGQMGRGLGTYSMKLFGERILGGQIYFTTTPQEGTCFYFSLPVTPPGT
jgi:hypothetical protein